MNLQRSRIVLGLVLVLVLGASAVSNAQDGARIPSSILGVHIGATRAQVAQALEAHGSVAGHETRDGGRKDAWTLRDTDFSSLAIRSNKQGDVVWVRAFVRPERQLPFFAVGDVSAAIQKMDSKIVWQGENAGKKYQLIASGKNGRAQTLLLIALD